MAKTIVILGANLTGIPIAHYLLKHSAAKVEDLKVIVVAPNTHMYWNLASVRAILPNMMGDDKLFHEIAPAFAKYPSDRYELVTGVAEKVDPETNAVEVRGNDGSSRTIQYDELVVATGSSFKADMPFKNLSTTAQTKDALHEWAKRIEAAESIVVAGAGLTGIEVAGELGQEYGTTGKKKITLICDQDLPLSSNFKRDVRETAKKELERLKVTVITSAKVTSPASATTKTITLSKKTSPTEKATTTTTLSTDLLIPTYGATPNTSFLPPSMLDARGFVKQTTRLRAEGHENIFVVGDAGNLEEPQGVHADAQTVHVVKLIEAQLLGQAAAVGDYKPAEKIMFAATLGRNTGTGQVGGWKVWGWLVKRMKGKYLGTEYAGGIARGERTMTAKSW